MPSQFIRLHSYGEHPGARRKSHENAFDIVDEAARVPGSTPHIVKTKPPNQLWGMPMQAVRTRLTDFVAIARDRRGARLRRDGIVLYAIMASYPVAWRHLHSPDAHAEYKRWLGAVVEWLQAQFGEQMLAVVEHVDEGHPHLHAFVIPPLCPLNRIDHRLHPGHAAREAVLENGGDRLAGERAYREGMRLWQDDFHAVVSRHFGHERIGPRRKRFRRDTALMRQSSERFLERAESILVQLARRLDPHDLASNADEQAELAGIVELLRGARRRLLTGHADALENLGAALIALDEANAQNRMNYDMPGEAVEPAYTEGDNEGFLLPDEIGVDNHDHDDDPDPGIFDETDLERDLDSLEDDWYVPEPPDGPDDIDHDN